MTSSPAQTKVSLLARPMRFPARMAANVGFKPTMPTTAVMTQSTCGSVAASIRPSSPHVTLVGRSAIATCSCAAASGLAITASSGINSRHCCAMRSTLEDAVSAATRTPSRFLIMSRLCRPMEPVEPKILIHFFIKSNHHGNQKQQRFCQRRSDQHGIKPIQNATVPGN